jgi:hypothetical protein
VKVKLIIPVLILNFIISSQIFGGTTGKIVGVIKDKTTGEGLIGVNIVIEGTTLGATTDLDGSYLILEEATVEFGEAIEVVAEREVIQKDLTSSQVEVTAEDIAALPSESFEDVLWRTGLMVFR